jgi:hypothetical protein
MIYLYDIPVYRLTQDQYTEENRTEAQAIIDQGPTPYPEDIQRQIHEHSQSRQGPWIFNEIIGYLRIHRLGTQIRAEYFSSVNKRCVRPRKKIITYKTHKIGYEIDINQPYETPQILQAVYECIALCKSELPRRFVDDSLFMTIAPHVDWAAIHKPDI